MQIGNIVLKSKSSIVKGPYELWKEHNPLGTPQQFLDSLKAESTTNLIIQAETPNPIEIKNDVLWIQHSMGPNGKGLTFNLVRKK